MFRRITLVSLFIAALVPQHASAAATTVSLLTAPLPTTSTSPSYTSDDTFRETVLNSTNTYRAQHNATALAWNTSLADYAQNWARRCNFVHSQGPNGENLAAGYANVTAAIEDWGNERSSYNFGKGDFSEKTGHFTQLVWKSTTSVGCGKAECNGKGGSPGWYVVCEYWPAGNVLGAFQQNVQSRVGAQGESGGVRVSVGVLYTVTAMVVMGVVGLA